MSYALSKSATVADFVNDLNRLGWGLEKTNCRVWDFHNGQKLKVLDNWEKQMDALQIIDGQHVLVEEKKKNGSWPNDKIYKRFNDRNSSYSSYQRSPTDPGKTGPFLSLTPFQFSCD